MNKRFYRFSVKEYMKVMHTEYPPDYIKELDGEVIDFEDNEFMTYSHSLIVMKDWCI